MTVLSGKRIALLGLPPDLAAEWTRILQDADAFTRPLSPLQIDPSSDVLKPFELILLDVASAGGTAWLQPKELEPKELQPKQPEPPTIAHVNERCIAVGHFPALLQVASAKTPEFREYLSTAAPPDELLLRCVLGLRARPNSAAPGQAASVLAGSTVVLADDDTSVTAIVRRALERNGMTCEVATNGHEALALITRLKPGSAVLDVHMPAIDGFEVLSRIKSVPELAQIRVILLTGSEQESDIIRGFTLGADDYICKPFNPMELTIRLLRVIGRL